MLQPGQCSGWLSGGSSCCLSPSLAAVAPSSLPGLLPSSCTQLVLVQRKTNHTLVFSSSFCFLGQIILWLLLLHCLLNNSDISVLLFSITGFAVSIWVLSVNAYLSPLGKIHLFLLLQSEAPVVSDRYTTLAAHTTTRQTTEPLSCFWSWFHHRLSCTCREITEPRLQFYHFSWEWWILHWAGESCWISFTVTYIRLVWGDYTQDVLPLQGVWHLISDTVFGRYGAAQVRMHFMVTAPLLFKSAQETYETGWGSKSGSDYQTHSAEIFFEQLVEVRM